LHQRQTNSICRQRRIAQADQLLQKGISRLPVGQTRFACAQSPGFGHIDHSAQPISWHSNIMRHEDWFLAVCAFSPVQADSAGMPY
jgi:hypothetical protein